ncbi:putative palmitoyltransferase ZDHHC13 [Scleropages formosus]|uniref:Palmitoyltransferase n=1 Tax=Scleropages formosus TaxID=113540 RepID=A0A0P7XHI8_SCLFO|nr:putative palmitoyltransferase ZDHHC13 [Scleropages formosus]
MCIPNSQCLSHSHSEDHFHGHGEQLHCEGHGHGHGHGHGGLMYGFRPGMNGQFAPRTEIIMDPTQQPQRRSHMDDSSSWDIVKATQFGILDRCKELVEAGHDVRQPDKENVSLLHWAAINNRTELVKYYLSKGAIIDQLGGDLNSTPLHWAIRQGHLSMVILLMRHGADPSLADGEGFRGLHLAVLFQHMPIAAYLMAKGQEVDFPDLNGQTSLMLAAQKIIGPEPTNFLIKCNASVNAVDKENMNSPLHCAVLAGNVDAVHILLEAGASVDLQNAKGYTPIDLAHQVHSPLLVHMLNHVKQERIKSNSPCFKIFSKYKFQLHLLSLTVLLWAVGAILDLNSESWLLKGVLLASVLAVVNLCSRRLTHPDINKFFPATFLIASIFWMLVTWCLWFLPDILRRVKILFTLSSTGLFYYYFRSWRTDPGHIKATEEERKKNVVVLAEAGCLDPRVFCTSCMMRKPVRAHHCFSCDSCIAKQDHHSVWINGCVGARNHAYFVLFLLFLSVVCAWMFYGSLIYWSKHCHLNYNEQGAWGVFTELVGCSPWVLYIFTLTFIHTSWASFFLLLQVYQIAVYGLTTSERMNLLQRRRKLPQSFSLRQNPYNSGVVRNMVNFFQLRCCGLCKPVVVDWTQQFSLGPDLSVASGFNTV